MSRFPRRFAVLGMAVMVAGVLHGAPAQEPLIPLGTRIAVLTADVIDSNGSNLDMEYNASTADPIVAGTVVLVPKGTPAVLRVVQLNQARAVGGRDSLGIRLVALMIDGKRVNVHTEQATIQSDSQGNKATKGGVLGGIIGAVVGGVTGGAGGAAKGAAIGAAAGVGAAAISGVKVHVEKETRLSFKVIDPSAPPVPEATQAGEVAAEGFTVTVDGCKRQRTASVTCELTVINKRGDRQLFLERGSMVDSTGIEQHAAKMQLGNSRFTAGPADGKAVYDKPVRAKLEFGGVPPDVTSLTALTATFASTGPGGQVRFDATFQNVPLPR